MGWRDPEVGGGLLDGQVFGIGVELRQCHLRWRGLDQRKLRAIKVSNSVPYMGDVLPGEYGSVSHKPSNQVEPWHRIKGDGDIQGRIADAAIVSQHISGTPSLSGTIPCEEHICFCINRGCYVDAVFGRSLGY